MYGNPKKRLDEQKNWKLLRSLKSKSPSPDSQSGMEGASFILDVTMAESIFSVGVRTKSHLLFGALRVCGGIIGFVGCTMKRQCAECTGHVSYAELCKDSFRPMFWLSTLLRRFLIQTW